MSLEKDSSCHFSGLFFLVGGSGLAILAICLPALTGLGLANLAIRITALTGDY